MKKLKVTIDNEEIEIKKMPIGKYADLVKQIKKLPSHFQAIENISEAKVVEALPSIIGDSLPDLLGVLSVATDLTVDQLETCGLDDITRLVKAVFEVNNYAEVIDIIKKALAHPTVKTAIAQPTTS